MAPLWLVSGVLIGIGIVGFFTGLILAFLGLTLAAYLLSKDAGGRWFFIVGAGVGAAALVLDDVLSYGDGSCRPSPDPHSAFHECPPGGVREIFWMGVFLAVIGITGAVITWRRSGRSRQQDVGRPASKS